MLLQTTDIATDRQRGPMSDMILYTDHPFLPIHAALFSNFDGTCSVVVSDRAGRNCEADYSVSLSGSKWAATGAMEVVLRPRGGNRPSELMTFEDTGSLFTGIRFEIPDEIPALV